METKKEFTRYEIARVIGARALQIAMDAPLLMKISDEELKEMKFDAIQIAEKEFESNVLPIAINRPVPQMKKEKLVEIKEEKVTDAELIAKEKAMEKEIAEKPEEYSLVEEEEKIEESPETVEDQ